jgi:hypothetical protein
LRFKTSLDAELAMALLDYLNSLKDAVSSDALEHSTSYNSNLSRELLSVVLEFTPMKLVKSYFLATAALFSAWTPHVDAQNECPDFTTYSQVWCGLRFC